MAIPSELRREVIKRAKDRCEYCGLAQQGQEATFHIDHIIPVSENGPTKLSNLALACVSCSLKKGARFWLTDPESGEKVGSDFSSSTGYLGRPFLLERLVCRRSHCYRNNHN